MLPEKTECNTVKSKEKNKKNPFLNHLKEHLSEIKKC